MKEIKNKLVELLKQQILENSDNVCTSELGDVMDMVKDIYEMKKYESESRYYESVVNAMEGSNKSKIKYASKPDVISRMYYSSPVNEYEGKSPSVRKDYMESIGSDRMIELDAYIDALACDINEMMTILSPEEKESAHQKISMLITKIM